MDERLANQLPSFLFVLERPLIDAGCDFLENKPREVLVLGTAVNERGARGPPQRIQQPDERNCLFILFSACFDFLREGKRGGFALDDKSTKLLRDGNKFLADNGQPDLPLVA